MDDRCRKLREELGDEVVCAGGPGYDAAREVHNARFDLHPFAVAFCSDAEDVATCIRLAQEGGYRIRVRSGGHNHEGLCSGEDVLVVDTTHLGEITYEAGGVRAWIPAGMRLADVYTALSRRGRVIPGGVCDWVRVGGLTQGGGWGLWVRNLGMTCDNVVGAEIVLADGTVRTIAPDTLDHADLLWALRGGGGGNFGVVTRFCFRLSERKEPVYGVRLYWLGESARAVADAWIEHAPDAPPELSSFLRLSSSPHGSDTSEAGYTVLMVGVFSGTEEELLEALAPITDAAEPDAREIEPLPPADDWLTRPPAPGLFAEIGPSPGLHLGMEEAEAPAPHKVTSTFADEGFRGDAIGALVDFVQTPTGFGPEVKAYVSLHALGGRLTEYPDAECAFPYRDKRLIIQPQAWWETQPDPRQDDYIAWIAEARATVGTFGTEGAFINFIDREVALEEYYGKSYDRLREVKRTYDREDFFSFEMSIPPAT
jgi:FAD/FMN-containing dehydrogenase